MFKRFNELYRSVLVVWFVCGIVLAGLFIFLLVKGSPSLENPIAREFWFCLYMGLLEIFPVLAHLYYTLRKSEKLFALIIREESSLYKSAYLDLLDVPLKLRGLIIISESHLAGGLLAGALMFYIPMSGFLHAFLADDIRFFYPYAVLMAVEFILGTPSLDRIEKRMQMWIRYVERHESGLMDSRGSLSNGSPILPHR